MKYPKILKNAFALLLAGVFAVGMTSCSSNSDTSDGTVDIYDTSEGVAVTVNGVEIGEKAITAYIESYRSLNSLDDDDSWAEWLVSYEYTPEDIRTDVIDYYTSQELLRQAAEENGVTADSDEIESQIETMRSYYDSDEAWEEALESNGLTEDSYYDLLELSALEEALMEVVATASEPSEDDLLSYGESYATSYDGAKKSSHILFSSDDEETAQEVLDLINSGELDFAEAAEQYSTDTGSAEDGGNVGWDALTTFVDEYQEALDELEEGEVSGLVTSSYGIHIIMCTEVFEAPDEVTSMDQLPDEFVESITEYLEETSLEESYTEWFDEYEEASEIEVTDMPEGLSYDVDLSDYTTDEDEEETTDTTDESDDTTDDTETTTESEDTDSDSTEDDTTTDEDTDTDTSDSSSE